MNCVNHDCVSRDPSAKYYQNNKEKLVKKACEIHQSRSKEKKIEKIDNMVVNDTKIYQEMKNKNFLSIKKILKNQKKCPIVIIRNYYFKK